MPAKITNEFPGERQKKIIADLSSKLRETFQEAFPKISLENYPAAEEWFIAIFERIISESTPSYEKEELSPIVRKIFLQLAIQIYVAYENGVFYSPSMLEQFFVQNSLKVIGETFFSMKE